MGSNAGSVEAPILPVTPPDPTAAASNNDHGLLSAYLNHQRLNPSTTSGRASRIRSRSTGGLRTNAATSSNFGQNEPSGSVFGSPESRGRHSLGSGHINQAPAIGRSRSSATEQSATSVPIFSFGQQQQQGQDQEQDASGAPQTTFSFRSLHNATPTRSPLASPSVMSADSSPGILTPSPGSSMAGTERSPSRHLSPPPFSLARVSSPASAGISDRLRSLSLSGGQSPSRSSSVAISPSPAEGVSGQQPVVPDRSTTDYIASGDRDGTGPAKRLKPYNALDEPTPSHTFFTSDFQGKIRSGVDIAKGTVAAMEKLQTSVELDSSSRDLLSEARSMTSYQGSETKRIAVLGDSGEGKHELFLFLPLQH